MMMKGLVLFLAVATGQSFSLRMATGGAKPLRIGTRGSPLALAQAHETKKRLGEAFPELAEEGAVEICTIMTKGDAILDKALSEIGGKGLFTKELDVSLINCEVDLNVHSTKDVPTWLPDGTILPCMLPREDTRDAFISEKGATIADLPDGSIIGSASLRRQAQILAINPTLKVVNFRGNVQSRLRKLREGVVDATLLAIAGLNRMDMQDAATSVLEYETMLPAVAQGAISIQCREDDEQTLKYIMALNDPDTNTAVTCERAFLATLDGNCRTPIAGQAKVLPDGQLEFQGLIASPDGTKIYKTERTGKKEDAVAIGEAAGQELREQAGEQFFLDMQEYQQETGGRPPSAVAA